MTHRVLVELLRGRGAHADPVQCFLGIDPHLAGSEVDGYPHTLWQILWHVNYWMRFELARIGGASPAYPLHAAESWPGRAPAGVAEWEVEVKSLESLLTKLSGLAESSEASLRAPVPQASSAHTGTDNTLLGVLCQTALHNSYHLGQAVLLRRVLGAFPLPGGGDTW